MGYDIYSTFSRNFTASVSQDFFWFITALPTILHEPYLHGYVTHRRRSRNRTTPNRAPQPSVKADTHYKYWLHVNSCWASCHIAQTKRRPVGEIKSLTTRTLATWGVEEQRNWTKPKKCQEPSIKVWHTPNFHPVPIGHRPGNSARLTMTSLRV